MAPLPDSAKAMGAGPAWDGYIAVVPTSTLAGGGGGGTIYKAPEDIPGVGRFAVMGDPHGASFMLFSPTPGDEPPPAPRRTRWPRRLA